MIKLKTLRQVKMEDQPRLFEWVESHVSFKEKEHFLAEIKGRSDLSEGSSITDSEGKGRGPLLEECRDPLEAKN